MRFAIPFLVFATVGILDAFPSVAADPQNLIQQENAHEGARDWQLTRVQVEAAGCRSNRIEGYCSKQSVKAGESIDIMVETVERVGIAR